MMNYFEGKTLTGLVPDNIENDVKSIFTVYEVCVLPNKQVIVKVPKVEYEKVAEFNDKVKKILLQVKEKNSVLAEKLARRHRVI